MYRIDSIRVSDIMVAGSIRWCYDSEHPSNAGVMQSQKLGEMARNAQFNLVDLDTQEEKLVNYEELIELFKTKEIYKQFDLGGSIVASAISDKGVFCSRNIEYLGTTQILRVDDVIPSSEKPKVQAFLDSERDKAFAHNYLYSLTCPDIVNIASSDPYYFRALISITNFGSTMEYVYPISNVYDMIYRLSEYIIRYPNNIMGTIRKCKDDNSAFISGSKEITNYCIHRFKYNPKIWMELL